MPISSHMNVADLGGTGTVGSSEPNIQGDTPYTFIAANSILSSTSN